MSPSTTPSTSTSTNSTLKQAESDDPNAFDVLEDLASTYQRALETRQISYMARYSSIQQAATISVAFMICFLVGGSAFFMATVENASIADTVLIAMYTLTSAGYGSVTVPKTDAFLVAFIFYIFVAISALAILVAQTFQYLSFESRRFKHKADKLQGAAHGVEYLANLREEQEGLDGDEEASDAFDRMVREELFRSLQNVKSDKRFAPRLFSIRKFARTEVGRCVLTLTIFTVLLLVGTFGMMAFEGWDFMDALYFSVFSMTTVGYGNLKPTSDASTWFVCVWLPTNVLFLALYLGTVAHYWVMFCNFNRTRVERNLRRQLDLPDAPPSAANVDVRANKIAGADDSDDSGDRASATAPASLATLAIEKSHRAVTLETRRQSVREGLNRRELLRTMTSGRRSLTAAAGTTRNNDGTNGDSARDDGNASKGENLDNMQGLLEMLHDKLERGEVFDTHEKFNALLFGGEADEDSLFSLGSNPGSAPGAVADVPLALRILVQERLARVIALEIAGSPFRAEVKDEETLQVTLEVLGEVGDRWLVPSAARTAYRRVAFCALFYAGERDLLKYGARAFLDMNPVQFNSLLSPFVVAMREASIMEGWLAATEELAMTSFAGGGSTEGRGGGDALNAIEEEEKRCSDEQQQRHAATEQTLYGPRCVVKEEIDDFFPVNQGNATLITQM